MKRLTILAVSTLGLSAAMGIAQAQMGDGPPNGERPSMDQLMERVDADDDGKISKEEAPERMAENFDRIDTDGDGYITLEELQNRPERPAQ